MGAVQAITRIRGGKRQLRQGVLAIGQKLDKARINQEGVLQHNGDGKRTQGDVPVKGPQGLLEGEDKPNIGTPSHCSESRRAAYS